MIGKINLFAALCILAQVCAFAPKARNSRGSYHTSLLESLPKSDEHSLDDILDQKRGLLASSAAGLVTGLGSLVAQGMASDDYEIAELPPPYVPAIFGVVLLAGVGVLTASLGDVMDEGEKTASSITV